MSEGHSNLSEITPDRREQLRLGFECSFEYNGNTYSTKASKFGNRPDETWFQISIDMHTKKNRLFRKPEQRQTQVADITVKYVKTEDEHPTFHIMGNYNLMHAHEGHPAKGIVGFALQEIIQKSGYTLEVNGLTSDGIKLYERLVANHRDSLDVKKTGIAEYRLSPRTTVELDPKSSRE